MGSVESLEGGQGERRDNNVGRGKCENGDISDTKESLDGELRDGILKVRDIDES